MKKEEKEKKHQDPSTQAPSDKHQATSNKAPNDEHQAPSTQVTSDSIQTSELEEERNKRLQLMADFQNYKKRMEMERATFGAMANMSLITELLEIYDDLELAMSDSELDLDRAKSSIKTAQDKLSGATKSAGVEKVEVKVGDEFDATKMEAIQTVPNEEMKNKVIAVISSAYKYVGQEGILKAAKVIVGK